MSGRSLKLTALGVILSLLMSACQTLAGSQTATVNLADPDTRTAVTTALAEAVNRARVELGPTDAAETSVITVLPPPPGPYETHAMGLPVRFDIAFREGRCVAIRHDTGTAYELPGVACKATTP